MNFMAEVVTDKALNTTTSYLVLVRFDKLHGGSGDRQSIVYQLCDVMVLYSQQQQKIILPTL